MLQLQLEHYNSATVTLFIISLWKIIIRDFFAANELIRLMLTNWLATRCTDGPHLASKLPEFLLPLLLLTVVVVVICLFR